MAAFRLWHVHPCIRTPNGFPPTFAPKRRAVRVTSSYANCVVFDPNWSVITKASVVIRGLATGFLGIHGCNEIRSTEQEA
jgi:hypothetical protein